MLAFAYAECGLNVDEFFNLSFYEWSLEVYKVKHRRKREFNKWESDAVFVREILTMMANINRDTKKRPTPFEPHEFIKLSFDKVGEKTEEPLTEKQMKEKL